MELTLKQYADSLGISYEAVRESFTRHKDKELQEGVHYKRAGRQRILTDEGIAAMNGYRLKIPAILPGDVVKYEEQIAGLKEQVSVLEERLALQEEENADLRLQIEGLNAEVKDLQHRLIESMYFVQELQGRLLSAAEVPKKQGFFSRLFNRNQGEGRKD